MTAGALQLLPVHGVPEVAPGDDLPALLSDVLRRRGPAPAPGDVLVVTHKVVSKAEGRIVDLDEVEPSPAATDLARRTGRDAHVAELVLRESARMLRASPRALIAETRHGFVCANAGVDRSNVRAGKAVLLPLDPDASAERIRDRLARTGHAAPAVIISDTFGRPWRLGQTDVAVGVAGMRPLRDNRGERDDYGNELHVTLAAVADELAGAADLVMGKTGRVAAVLVRGFRFTPGPGSARDLVRPARHDLFR